MDFLAHLLWSGIIFAGPQGWYAVIFGGLPDLIPFGLNMIIAPFRERKKRKNGELSQKRPMQHRREGIIEFYEQHENQWVYKVYNYTHSLIVWLAIFLAIYIPTRNTGFFPLFMFAWLLHILIDIPTHEKVFFAPQFLIPLSKFCVNGKSWARPKFMAINYILIVIGIILQVIY